ncbi:MAG: alpha/beta hydrolase [Bradymonadia bacterium]
MYAYAEHPVPEVTTTTIGHGLELLSCLPEQATRPPILCVHGAFAGAWCWAEHFMPWFAERGYPIYAVSLRGHGESQGEEHLARHTLRDYVRDVICAVEHIGEPPIVVGHSMGGFVAQKYLEYSGRRGMGLLGVALMASVPPQGLIPTATLMMMTRPALTRRVMLLCSGGPELAARFTRPNDLRRSLFSSALPSATLTEYFSRFQGESQRAVLDMSLLDPLRLWLMPRVPIITFGAEHDAFIPPALIQATAMTYGCPSQIVRGMGHVMMLERHWEEAAQPLYRWAEQVSAQHAPAEHCEEMPSAEMSSAEMSSAEPFSAEASGAA